MFTMVYVRFPKNHKGYPNGREWFIYLYHEKRIQTWYRVEGNFSYDIKKPFLTEDWDLWQ